VEKPELLHQDPPDLALGTDISSAAISTFKVAIKIATLNVIRKAKETAAELPVIGIKIAT